MQVLKTEVLNELYERTESRIKDLHSFRQMLIAIKTFEEFSLHKIKFTQFFFDIEDELREALQNAKSSYIEIKELKDQLELFKQRYAILEKKHSNTDEYIRELKGNVKECLEQMKLQDNLRLSNEKYIGELEKKLRNLELENKILRSDNYEKRVSNVAETFAIQDNDNYNILKRNLNVNDDNNINKLNSGNLNCNVGLNHKKIEEENLKQENSKLFNNELVEKEENKKTEFSNANLNRNQALNDNSIKNKEIQSSHSKNNNDINNEFYQNTNVSFKTNNTKNDLNYPTNNHNNVNNRSKNNEAAEESMDSSFLYKIREKLNYSQYNDIITERENSKKLINDFIKDSLSFNYNNNNNIRENDNYSPTKNLHYNYNRNLIYNDFGINEDKKIVTFGRDEEDKNYPININNNHNNKSNEKDLVLIKNENTKNAMNNNNGDSKKIKLESTEQPESQRTSNKFDNQKHKAFKNTTEINYYDNNSINENYIKDSNKQVSQEPIRESLSPKKVSKADKILEIVIKIRTIEDISSIVFHLFGEDVLDKIISPNVDEELIEKVDATIQEIERLMEKEEYNETEPLQDPPKKIVTHHPSIIEEKEEESTFVNNTLNNNHKESSNNLINNQLNDLPNSNNKNPNTANYSNLNIQLNNRNSDKHIVANAPIQNNSNINKNNLSNKNVNFNNNINNNQKDYELNNYDKTFNNNKNLENKSINNINYKMTDEAEDYKSTPSVQSPSNLNLKTVNEIESNYSKMLNNNNAYNYNNNNNVGYTNPNNYTNPNLPSNSNNNVNFANQNWNQNNLNNNISKNAYKVYSTNSNDVSKTSYDILSENNLRRSGSKFKKSVGSNNRSFSKPQKEIFSKDSAAASRINFEKSLRNYNDSNENKESAGFSAINRVNTSSTVNKRIFNNYMRNKGELFDNNILRKYDAHYETRKKSNSRPKNRINRGENSQNSTDIKSIKEMQRFRELYERFKHLAVQSENTNYTPNRPSQGFIKRPSHDYRNNIQTENYANKSNTKEYLFNDDI